MDSSMASTRDDGFGACFEQIDCSHTIPFEETERAAPSVDDSHVEQSEKGATDPDNTPTTAAVGGDEKHNDARYFSRVVDSSSSWVETPLVRFVLQWEDSRHKVVKTTRSRLPFKYPTGTRLPLAAPRQYDRDDLRSISSTDSQLAAAYAPSTKPPEKPAGDDKPKPAFEIITRAFICPGISGFDNSFNPPRRRIHHGYRPSHPCTEDPDNPSPGRAHRGGSRMYDPTQALHSKDVGTVVLLGDAITYHYLYHISDDLRTYKDNQPDLHDEKYAKETAEHVDLLLSYIEYRFKGQRPITDLRGSALVRSTDMWMLYRPGTMAYYREKDSGPLRPCVIHQLCSSDRGLPWPFSPNSTPPCHPYRYVRIWTISWNKGRFERTDMEVTLTVAWPQRVDSLEVVPADLVKTNASADEQKLGVFCWELAKKPHYLEISPEYKFKRSRRDRRTGLPRGRAIVDFDEAPTCMSDQDDLYSHSSPRTRSSRDSFADAYAMSATIYDIPELEGRCECERCMAALGSRPLSVFGNLKFRDAKVDEMPKCKESFHAMDKNVPAWILATSSWEQVPARHLHYIQHNHDTSHDFIQTPKVTEAMAGYTKMLTSVSTWQTPASFLPPLELSPLTNYNGHVVLLHGPPGTGKSCSVMQLAESTLRPIVMLSVTLLESPYYPSLSELLQMAERYGCVLLIEDADVILGRRADRLSVDNKIFAAFIQALQKFTGLVFLTTNHVTDLDPAVMSHINSSIYFPPLTNDLRASLWRSRFTAIEARNKRIRERQTEHPHPTLTATPTPSTTIGIATGVSGSSVDLEKGDSPTSRHTPGDIPPPYSSSERRLGDHEEKSRETERETQGGGEKEVYISPQTQAFLLENKDIVSLGWNGRDVVKCLESAIVMARGEEASKYEGGTGATVVLETHFSRVIQNALALRGHVRGTSTTGVVLHNKIEREADEFERVDEKLEEKL